MSTSAIGTPGTAKVTQWQVDPTHSAAHFSVRHMMISTVRGEFGKSSGTAVIDYSDPTRSTVEVSVETGTIDTRDAQRDDHLRSPDFFDAATHPAITFRSTKIAAAGASNYKVTGDLTIRGVTREVTFNVEGPTPSVKDPYGNTRVGVSATGKINRKDFGMVFNSLLEGGGVMVGDEVSINFEAELIQKA